MLLAVTSIRLCTVLRKWPNIQGHISKFKTAHLRRPNRQQNKLLLVYIDSIGFGVRYFNCVYKLMTVKYWTHTLNALAYNRSQNNVNYLSKWEIHTQVSFLVPECSLCTINGTDNIRCMLQSKELPQIPEIKDLNVLIDEAVKFSPQCKQ